MEKGTSLDSIIGVCPLPHFTVPSAFRSCGTAPSKRLRRRGPRAKCCHVIVLLCWQPVGEPGQSQHQVAKGCRGFFPKADLRHVTMTCWPKNSASYTAINVPLLSSHNWFGGVAWLVNCGRWCLPESVCRKGWPPAGPRTQFGGARTATLAWPRQEIRACTILVLVYWGKKSKFAGR